jgi:hypothetical protein
MRMILSFTVTVILSFVAFSPVQAAPQTLLLVAQNEDLQFRCSNGRCSAEATAICMQGDRATPEAGTPYEVVEEKRFGTGREEGLTLVGRTSAGQDKSLPLEILGIVSEREHMAVRFTISEQVLKQHQVASLRLRMKHSVVLEPVWHEGDANPQYSSDIEETIGPGRDIAENIFAFRKDDVAVAQILRDLLNDLPREDVASVNERRAAFDNVLRRRMAGTEKGLTDRVRVQAKDAVASCGYIRDEEMWFRGYHTRVSRYRDCIGQRHDSLIREVNKTYWKAREGAGV